MREGIAGILVSETAHFEIVFWPMAPKGHLRERWVGGQVFVSH